MADALQQLIDRQEIRDCMARYARGVDRNDWEAVRDTYHPDAYDDHGDYKGDIYMSTHFAPDDTDRCAFSIWVPPELMRKVPA